MPAKKRSHSHGGAALFLIAIFKFVKGALLLALAFGALSLLHKDVASEVQHWLDQLRIDPDNQFIGALLSKLELGAYERVKGIKCAWHRLRRIVPHRRNRSALPKALGRMANYCCYKLVTADRGV